MTAALSTGLTLPTDSTPVAEAAETYARMGIPPVRIYGITRAGHCMCGHGCVGRSRGKHPIGEEWQRRTSLDLDTVRDTFRSHVGNIGLYLGTTPHVVLDADGEVGLATIETWQLPETLRAVSGSGVGAHLLYQLGSGQERSQLTDRKVAPGLDIKTKGQFVVAPSRHASGGVYRWVNSAPIAVMPDWLFERIRRTPTPVPAAPERSESPELLERRARAYVAEIEPGVQGRVGSNPTFAAARALAGFEQKGLAQSISWDILCEYNRRCQPPWSERELLHKLTDARTKATHIPTLADRPRLSLVSQTRVRSAPPIHDADGVLPPDEPPNPPSGGEPPGGQHERDWMQELLWAESKTGKSRLVSHSENVSRILQLHPAWRGRIRFDDFRARIALSEPPWDQYQRPTTRVTGYWNDNDATRMQGWLRRQYHGEGFNPTINDCERAVAVVAHNHGFNPVREYLDGCEWDGEPRLSKWLTTYLGAEDSQYSTMVGAWWLISAVARIYQPGCKVDTVPILEGAQGIRKSTALRVLAGDDWFNDTPIDIGSKDAYTAIQGCWFVELAELESLMRAEPSRSKAFFSSAKDHFRRAYARHETDELRQCIFVGTVNLVEYLGDPTGARRFHPIPCTRIDIDALVRDRDQLWAETVHEYRDGRVWYPTAESDHGELGLRQESRTRGDAWEPRILGYINRVAPGWDGWVSTNEILEHALDVPPKDWTHAAQTRVGIIMTSRLKWNKKRKTMPDGSRSWGYERPAERHVQ